MPLVKINERLHFFAHVPKCAGSSVERYLEDRFGRLAFVNRRYLDEPEALRWTKASPQHVPLKAFHKLVPETWIASSFAVVRHPMTRFASAFKFQAGHESSVPDDWTIDQFFDDWMSRKDSEPYLYDGHLLPQSDLVPEKAAIFRMEDGLEALVDHLDRLAGNTGGLRSMPAANSSEDRKPLSTERRTMSPETRERLTDYYAEDFSRFGYDPDVVPKHQPPPQPPLREKVVSKLRRRLRRN